MTRKLAGFGLAFALAELAAAYWPPLALWLTAAFAFLVLLVHRLRFGRLPPWLPVLAGLAAGVAWFGIYHAVIIAPQLAWSGQTVHCTGVVETDAETSYMDGMVRATLCLEQIDGEPANVRAYCTAFPGAAAGERFEADLVLTALGQDRYRAARYADGCYLNAEYAGAYIRLGQSMAPRFLLYELRMDLSAVLRTWLPRRLDGIAAAILLGDRAHLDESTEQAFRSAGVSHLLSVSGLHLSMLCGLFHAGRKRRSLYRPFLALQGIVVLFYMALTGFPVSVVRAGIIYLVALCGYALRQPPDLLTSLGAAAVLIGMQNACAPCDLGFQLSFCGVLGVQLAAAMLARPKRRLMMSKTQTESEKRTPWSLRALQVGLWLVETVSTAAFATLATLPSLLCAGLTVSGVAVLTNLLVVWALEPALILGILVLVFAALPPLAPCMHMGSLLLAVWLRGMDEIINWCAGLPGANLDLPRGYTLLVLAVLGILALAFRARGCLRWYPLAGVLCAVLGIWLGVRFSEDVVRVALVGTAGNACVVVTQGQSAILFFRGGASNLNAAEEYLLQTGVRQTAAVFDLRTEPSVLDFGATELYVLEEQEDRWTSCEVGGMNVDCGHAGSGNLAVLDVAGYHIAVPAGSWRDDKTISVDLLCAAASMPQGIEAQTVLTNSAAPRWLETCGQEAVYTGIDPVAVLRPGRSIVFEGVTELVVQ